MAIRGSSITRNSTIFPGYLCIFFLKRSKKEVASLSNLLFSRTNFERILETIEFSNFRAQRTFVESRRGKKWRQVQKESDRLGCKKRYREKKKRGKKIRITKMKLEKKKMYVIGCIARMSSFRCILVR